MFLQLLGQGAFFLARLKYTKAPQALSIIFSNISGRKDRVSSQPLLSDIIIWWTVLLSQGAMYVCNMALGLMSLCVFWNTADWQGQ